MPIYEVQDRQGNVSEAFVWTPSSELPTGFKRVEAPSRISIPSGCDKHPQGRDAIRKGYAKLENMGGSQWRSAWSKKQIKQAWGI